MSALSQPHTVATLLGSPPGYVGYGRPGLLAGVRERPSQVILFDEIEKAHPSVWTILMSILDDGRLVDAEGNALYFGDTIIVFTSNIGAAELMQLIASRGDDVSFDEIRDLTDNAVAQYFTELGMPEVYGRLEPGVVAFDILRPDALDQVATRLARAATFANGPDLHIDEASLCAMIRQRMADPTARALGGRQVRNVITAQLRELSVWLAEVGQSGAGRCAVSFDAGGMLADVDGAGPERVTDDLSVTNRDDELQEGV